MSSTNTPPPQFSPCCRDSRLSTFCGRIRSHIFRNFTGTRSEEKIDRLFLEILEILFRAQYMKPEEKLRYLVAGNGKLDLLKFFLQIGWENKLIDTKKYSVLSEELDAVGRMLGGWKKGIEAKLSSS